jgi:hypothetical protein
MALVMVPLDQWTWLIEGHLEVFVRGDPLADADYRTRWEVNLDPLHIRCLSPIPAGVWVRGPAAPPEVEPYEDDREIRRIDTEQFRAYVDEPSTGEFRMPDVVSDHVRRIDPDQIRRAREEYSGDHHLDR